MKWPSRRVVALPRSWSSAARRSAGGSVAAAASTAASEWSSASPGTAFDCGTPRSAASSGRITTRSPRRSRIPIAPDGVASSARMRISSSRTRSAETASTVGAASRIACSVAGSIVSSSRPANRAARIRRRASSANRSRGSPTARRTRASRSDWPPTGSTSVPRPASRSSGSHAIALIVKSRRARSSVSDTPKRTSSGRRRSRYVPSARYDVTSTTGSEPIVTVPNRFSQVAPGKRETTSSGRAAVAASHSPRCASPRSRSRTAPPTIATSWPASPSVRITSRTRWGSSGKTSSTGMTRILGPRRATTTAVDRQPCRSS